jgi:hypothetical protein
VSWLEVSGGVEKDSLEVRSCSYESVAAFCARRGEDSSSEIAHMLGGLAHCALDKSLLPVDVKEVGVSNLGLKLGYCFGFRHGRLQCGVLDIEGVIGRWNVEDASFLHHVDSVPQVIRTQGATAVSLDDCVIDPRKEDSAVSEVTELSEQDSCRHSVAGGEVCYIGADKEDSGGLPAIVQDTEGLTGTSNDRGYLEYRLTHGGMTPMG